ncbi:transcription antitermination factor NusB, partial [Clostridium saccharobutylicum]
PTGVAINEALEITRRYSDEKSVSFINGVLDKINKK